MSRLIRKEAIPDVLSLANEKPGGAHASCGPSLREKVIDVSRRLSKSALSLQVGAGRGDSITFGIQNCDLITVVALVVKYKLVPVMAMCAGCHLDLLHETWATLTISPRCNPPLRKRPDLSEHTTACRRRDFKDFEDRAVRVRRRTSLSCSCPPDSVINFASLLDWRSRCQSTNLRSARS